MCTRKYTHVHTQTPTCAQIHTTHTRSLQVKHLPAPDQDPYYPRSATPVGLGKARPLLNDQVRAPPRVCVVVCVCVRVRVRVSVCERKCACV